MESREVIKKAIYWTICTLLIFALFISVGGAAAMIYERGLGIHNFIAVLFGLLGVILVLVSLYRPKALFGIAKPPSGATGGTILRGAAVFHTAYGFSLIIGGILYLMFNNLLHLLIFILLPAGIIRALNFMKRPRNGHFKAKGQRGSGLGK